MPVWHEATKALRKAGTLEVVAITQEQHADRCKLFAQWKGLDFPILWDPFNLTGSHVVPRFILIDEHGVVRATRARPQTLEGDFLSKTFEAPEGGAAPPREDRRGVVQLDVKGIGKPAYRAWQAVSDLLWQPKPKWDDALDALAAVAGTDARARFRLGVAHRMRYDNGNGEGADFQRALDAWGRALSANPRQYIWRRRIQQYGPRLDKPYPFYDWVAKAQAEIRARGEEPVAVRVPLSGAEIAGRSTERRVAGHKEPDPKRAIERVAKTVAVETAVAPNTGRGPKRLRVHVVLRPVAGGGFTFDEEAGAPILWLGGNLVKPRNAGRIEQDGARFELELDDPGGALTGYALFHGCLEEDGECRYLRHDFVIER